MPNPPNPSQSPNAQSHREHDTSEAEPPSRLVAFEQGFGSLFVLVWGLCRDVGGDDCDKA